ncbi:AAA-like domain-containing protein [Planktothrix agardhii]|uniref:AAA-like domain-containing protein n=1 Tax=Planktothrix agardhii TaxID=1160 RepID=UPI001D09F8AF|nr:AAA-like domain-containing protein [Planktothrix agardhii]MCB8749161.1 AAA-like domain-containing protein [Planktothrix agardhii 1810]
MARYRYSIGGSLDHQNPTYVKRKADDELYNALKNGEFCYVLNSRQMGKSSLRVKMAKKLKQEGFKCVSVDMTKISSYGSAEEWYGDLMFMLLQGLSLDQKVNFELWLQECSYLSPLQKFNQFIETIILSQLQEKIIIFLDEIDSIIKIKFKDEFFAVIRSFYNQRSENQEYERLTFCLLGVATPSDLIQDKTRTPFNIGQAIELKGFEFEEAQSSLTQGLREVVDNPEEILKEILNWTGGQPFLTQKLCKLVVEKADSRTPNIDQIVQTYIINNWESQDEPEHLKTIRDRILYKEKSFYLVLGLYQQILKQGKIEADDNFEQSELRLSGLVIKDKDLLRPFNLIYQYTFNQEWIDQQLNQLRPYSHNKLQAWLNSGKRDNSKLLKGKNLDKAVKWLEQKYINDDYNFITKSKIHSLNKRDKGNKFLLCVYIIMVFVAVFNLFYERGVNKLDQEGINTLQQFYSGNEPIEALIQALQTGEELKPITINNYYFKNYPTVTPVFGLQQILDNIYERNPLGVLKSLDFSPDKKSFVTVSSSTNANIYLWNWLGQTVTQLKGHQGAVNQVVFSPDGQYIAGVGEDGFVHVWNFTGKHLLKFKAHKGAANSILFSPNSQYIATVGKDGFVRAWNKFGKKLIEFKSHNSDDSNDSSSIYFSYDSKRILIHPLQKSEAYILNLSGKQVAKLTWIPGGIDAGAVNITPNGQYIVTSEGGSMPTIWNWSGQQLAKLKGNRVNFSSDSQFVATIEFDGQAYLWNISGKLLAELKGHKSGVLDVSFSPNGKQLVTAGKDGIARVWNFSGEQIAELKRHRGSVTLVRFSPNGQLIATGGEDGKIRLWDLSGQEQLELTGHRRTVSSIDFSPDSKSLITYGNDEIARLWDVSGRQVTQLKNSKNRVRNVVFSPNNKYIATIEEDGIVQVWTFSGQILNSIKTQSDYIDSVNFNQDGKTIDILTYKNVQTWSLSGQLLNTENTNNQSPTKSNSQLGEDLEVETEKDWTILINNSSGKNLLKLKDKNYDSISNVILSPDGQHIAGIYQDRIVYIWDLSSKILAYLKVSQLEYFSFSPDGQRIATITKNGVVEIYDLRGRKLARWEVSPHPDYGVIARFSPDWRYVAIVGEDNKVVVWSVPQNLDELLERGCNWLSSYFANRPDERERLKVCQ